MAHRSEIATIYTASVIQGIALVTFPAASAVFTSPQSYGLSDTQYGLMFLPQVVTSVTAALAGAELRKRLGTKRIYLIGLVANLLSMLLLVASRFEMREHAIAYGILLGATGLMGIGFGFTVPALDTFAAAFFPKKTDKAVLILNALLGLGTALAPAFIALFVGLGIWWALPILVAVLVLGLMGFSLTQPLKDSPAARAKPAHQKKAAFPARFWIFAAFILFYGICETMNGNWASLYMKKQFGSGPAMASGALSLFWGAITAGRIVFAAVGKWFPERMVCRVLPLGVAVALVATACVPKSSGWLGLVTFALAGLSCSALLPLAVSFGQEQLTSISAGVAGGLIAFDQVGYGLAAFGVGPLQKWFGLELNVIFGGTAAVALAMWVVAFFITKTPTQRKAHS